jgi:hypothetical protein
MLAGKLRDKVAELEQQATSAGILLLGDFNDEPFDKSLADHLLATRDRELAKTKKGFLYNPFWRCLGEAHPHKHPMLARASSGSFFHRTGHRTRWRTFDQILFSAAFLGGGEWHLNEEQTTILRPELLVELVQTKDVIFDHFPVIGTIEKEPSQR